MNRNLFSKRLNLTVLRSVLFALLLLLLSPVTATNASPAPADSVGFFCQIVDYEQLERDQPLPAAKGLQNLDVGEPRTVRLIYFLPSGRSFRAEVVDSMKTGIREVQSFYAEQMQKNGYGNKTFRIETDDQGEPIVHRVDGGSIGQIFDLQANVYLVIHDSPTTLSGSGSRFGKNSGLATIFDGWNWFAAAHELGHAFGLQHDFRDNTYILSYGRRNRSSAQLSACTAEYLAVHPYFNPDIPIEEAPPPTIELTSSPNYPVGSSSVPVQLRVHDVEGLHQVLLLSTTPQVLHPAYGGRELIECRGLTGETDTVLVEFDYDGVVPSSGRTGLSDPAVHPIYVAAVDTAGNVSEASFSLAETSPQHIATLAGHATSVNSVSFSPDGTILASASFDSTVKLWNVSTREHSATLRHGRYVKSVAFSPDGATLASGARDVKLWNVSTKESVATLAGHTAGVSSVSFSPDGTILASGADDSERSRGDRTIKLWDVASRTNIATLEGHGRKITSVAFSPDGATLASVDHGYALKLWDVATRANVGTLENAGSRSLAFSLDGMTIASPGDYYNPKAIKLFDVGTRTHIATLDRQYTNDTWIGHEDWVRAVAISPDGRVLASGSQDRTVQLWDVEARAHLATLTGHTESVYAVAFSSAGTMLASASFDKTINLWDTSEWAGTPVVGAPAGICDRTPQVRDAIVAAVTGISNCSNVTDAHLAAITSLGLDRRSITSLKAGDLDGLTALTSLSLHHNQLSSLPVNIFHSLTALTRLDLSHNQLSSLPAGIFDNLNALTQLFLFSNQLSSLPVNIFDSLTALTRLDLNDNRLSSLPASIFDNPNALTFLRLDVNQLSSLPAGIFDSLTALTHLYLYDSQLSSLAAGIFDNLNALTFLHLSSNQLSSLPAGLFDGLSSLTTLYLNGNTVDPLPLTVSLGRVGTDQFKAVAPAGAPFDIVLPITVANGSINGGATTITIPAGRVDSDTVTVTRTSGATFAATVDIGNLPGLPANHSGYTLVKSGDLPLVVTEGTIVIWSATMTVGDNQYGKGWTSRTYISGDSLSDREFDFEGHTYRFSLIFVGNSFGYLNVSFASDGAGTIANQATRTKFNFHVGEGVGGKVFNLGEGHFSIVGAPRDREIRHSSWIVSWNRGDRVSLKITLAPEHEWTAISVSDRTPQVRDAIVASAGVNSASDVTDAHLAAITTLNLGYKSISLLKSGDFSGLSSLTTLFLHNNSSLTSLPEDVFEGLSSLQFLNLQDNGLTNLRENVFDGLSSLIHIGLYGNSLTILPEDLFGGLSSLHRIILRDNELTTLPNGMFEGVTSLQLLHLQGNSVDPLPLAVSLERVGTDQFKAVAPTGAPFNILLPVNVKNGSINGGATAVTIPLGSVESGPLTVSRTSGSTAAVTTDIGTLPGLPSNQQGYYLFKSPDLPLEVLVEEASQQIATDFNGDGKTDFVDFFQFVDAFGSTDPRFDLNGDGKVDFVDFFQFVDAFGSSGQAKLVAMAREMLGLPTETELQQNAPNPFNSETVISWFLLKAGPVRVEVFSLTGQRVAVLQQGGQQAGYHRLHWDGRDGQGRPVASGVYLYRLVTRETVLTRKLTLLR